MKTFFATLAAILCAAIIIGGYLRYTSEMAVWQRRRDAASKIYTARKQRLVILQKRVQENSDPYGGDERVLKNSEADFRIEAGEYAMVLRQKPFWGLSASEMSLLRTLSMDAQRGN